MSVRQPNSCSFNNGLSAVSSREKKNHKPSIEHRHFPTILDLLNIDECQEGVQGKSLSPFINRKIHDFVCAECGASVRSHLMGPDILKQIGKSCIIKLEPYDKGYKCLRTHFYKYIISADHKEELYNVKEDPLEIDNIAVKYPDKTKNFREKLESTIDISFFGPEEFPTENREEILKRLKSLGYI